MKLILVLYFSLTVRLASSALAFLLQLLRHVDKISSVACASEPVLDLQQTCEQFQSFFESDITSFNRDTEPLN
jgi:3-methyladenine DNA glycosylase Tag